MIDYLIQFHSLALYRIVMNCIEYEKQSYDILLEKPIKQLIGVDSNESLF